LRLHLLKQQAEAGDITLLFGDESEALTHPYLARAWAKRGGDLRVEAPGQSKKRAMIGALDCAAHHCGSGNCKSWPTRSGFGSTSTICRRAPASGTKSSTASSPSSAKTGGPNRSSATRPSFS